jgi:uncharacterized protein YecE (DUF72 family)
MRISGDIRIGVSGWTYPPWRGNFYPKGLPQRRELEFASRQFNAIEINGTFYGMQVPPSFAGWAAAAPADLLFAVKGPRFLTHMLKLTRLETPLANFFASGVLALGDKLGPILWQFPERFAFDPARLIPFFEMLPRTTREAARLGARHDQRLRAAPHLDAGRDRPIRHAMEIRHGGFRDPAFIGLLRRYGIALVCADTVDWPLLMDVTADFVYCRLHGSTELYKSRYSDADLDRWAGRARAWSRGETMTDGTFVTPPLADGRPRDVFVFFDNTDKLEAPGNARGLMDRLGVAPAGVAPAAASASIAAE